MAAQGETIDYVIGRAKRESDRLDSQHYMIVRSFGFVLHPSIFQTLGPNSRVADIATGTAIWLEDLAKQLPSTCSLHGFDISSDQYPPVEALPSNIQLHIHNATQPFPANLHGTFDAVQIRCIAAGAKDGDWPIIFQNLLQLLKPGGAIQWIEPDINWFLKPLRGENGAYPTAHEYVSHKVWELSGLGAQGNVGMIVLPAIFNDAGMTGIVKGTRDRDSVPEMKNEMMINFVGVMSNSLETLSKKEVKGAPTLDEVAKLREQALEEVRQGCYYPVPFQLLAGFKPS